MLGNDGNFYGTTANGGSGYVEGSKPGYGTVFKVTTNGVLTTLVSFNDDNGAGPDEAVEGACHDPVTLPADAASRG